MKIFSASILNKTGVIIPEGHYFGVMREHTVSFVYASNIYTFLVADNVTGIDVLVDIEMKIENGQQTFIVDTL
jgi:hypothetical protein